LPQDLSKNDINSLLSGIASGKVQPSKKSTEIRKTVSEYNFKKALRFSKEHISVLHKIHEKFARELTTVFSIKLRTPVEVEVQNLKQITFQEYIENIEDGTVQTIMNTAPTDGQMMLDMSGDIAHCMLERLFGGPGTNVDKYQPLTRIEQTIMRSVLLTITECKKRAWSPIVRPRIEESDIEVNPKNLYIFSAEETVIVAKLSFIIGELEGELNVCLPYFVLQPIAYRLSTSRLLAPKKASQEKKESVTLKTKINATLLDVVANLGDAEIHVEDFLQLAVGDVIKMKQNIYDTSTIYVNGKPKFTGQPGLKHGKVSIQIRDEILEEDHL
jgi:flagellar motor switch protein FliM